MNQRDSVELSYDGSCGVGCSGIRCKPHRLACGLLVFAVLVFPLRAVFSDGDTPQDDFLNFGMTSLDNGNGDDQEKAKPAKPVVKKKQAPKKQPARPSSGTSANGADSKKPAGNGISAPQDKSNGTPAEPVAVQPPATAPVSESKPNTVAAPPGSSPASAVPPKPTAPAVEPGPEKVREWHLLNGTPLKGVWDLSRGDNTQVIVINGGNSIYEVKLVDLSGADRTYVRTKLAMENPDKVQKTEEIPLTVTNAKNLSTQGSMPGDRRTILVNTVEFGFCWCPPGTFTMGSPDDEENRENFENEHEVTLSKGFWILETEVTQQLWKFVMGRNIKEELIQSQPNIGGVFEANEMDKLDRLGVGDRYPMYNISYDDANKFCFALRNKTGLAFSLPTEAQWEYACRAGIPGPFAVTSETKQFQNEKGQEVTYFSMTELSDMGWYIDNSKDGLHPVKSKLPNPWGIYDMHGNVWEMCKDYYKKDFYGESPAVDPEGPPSGAYRVNRGGGWFSLKKFCRSACRYRNAPGYRYNNLGFRIVVTPQ